MEQMDSSASVLNSGEDLIVQMVIYLFELHTQILVVDVQ